MRTFAYCRVSTSDQTTDNQILEIKSAGFDIEPRRILTETISGATPSKSRPEFSRLMDRLESGDVLIITKLDRLGRDAMDVRATVQRLTDLGVRVHCLQLGGVDLTSAAGKMTMQVISAMAEFERDLLLERVKAGQIRAVAAGTHMGRKFTFGLAKRKQIRLRLDAGEKPYRLAKELGTSTNTIMRIKKEERLKNGNLSSNISNGINEETDSPKNLTIND